MSEENTPATPDETPHEKAVNAMRKRLEGIVAKTQLYRDQNFKKVMASTVIADNEFLLQVIETISDVNRTMQEAMNELREPTPTDLVGLDGKTLSTETAGKLLLA